MNNNRQHRHSFCQRRKITTGQHSYYNNVSETEQTETKETEEEKPETEEKQETEKKEKK